MLFGFSIGAEGGGRNFGIVSASSEAEARQFVCTDFELIHHEVEICDPEDLLNTQYERLALLTTES